MTRHPSPDQIRSSAVRTPRCPVLPSHVGAGKGRTLGWLASTSVAALLVSAIGAWAMTRMEEAGDAMGAEEEAILVMLPDVPAIEAISEPTPDVADQAPAEAVDSPDTEETPDMPEVTEAPDIPDEAPEIEELLAEDIPEVETEPPPKPVVEVPKKKAEAPKEKAKEKPKKKASEEAAASKRSSQASAAQASSGSGSASAQSYDGQVMKKIKRTRKKSLKRGGGGTAVVSFTVNANGSLGSVGIARSSGSTEVDEVGKDHIRRSAPFPPPPPGARTKFTFNFEG
ncbi:TonB family protein [Xinfangfangia sp. D13-10-4-6]|uniref:TonB family protein n=1 Tax=Pseudogemmobacter hezensis TaxID=2737662 RepID=UPI0015567292|nr:TonB family protein [Pseudogemmobacter hezensis]NPD17126.1 TonB family protein [Pseudogemmobacter hezensis]